jgi:hypothetical protein
MLNYLGPSVGPQGPMATQLPPATPGTMPAGINGVQPTPAPIPPAPPMHSKGSHAPASALLAIIKHAANGGGIQPTPPPPSYHAVTQQDGSILLHVKGPNGELGPVVKYLPPLKQNQKAGA